MRKIAKVAESESEEVVQEEFEGIENVSPAERARQYALAEALWSKLMEQGLNEGAAGRMECIFFAGSAEAADALLLAFGGWECEVFEPDESSETYSLRIVSPLVHLTKSALLELVDVSLIAASESTCTFDGFQIDTIGLKRRPWWKFW